MQAWVLLRQRVDVLADRYAAFRRQLAKLERQYRISTGEAS